MPFYPKFSEEEGTLDPVKFQAFSRTSIRALMTFYQHCQTINPLRAGTHLIHFLNSSQNCVLHLVNFYCCSLLHCNTHHQFKREIPDYFWILCVVLVEEVVSGLQALFAYLYNGNHTIHLIQKATVRNKRNSMQRIKGNTSVLFLPSPVRRGRPTHHPMLRHSTLHVRY